MRFDQGETDVPVRAGPKAPTTTNSGDTPENEQISSGKTAENPPEEPEAPNDTAVDHLGPNFEALPHESAYVCSVRSGEGTVDGRTGNTALPCGVQASSGEIGNLAAELGMLGSEGEMDEDDEEIFAMVTDTAEIESSDPMTVEEARARPDWPRWDEAMQKELKALEDAHTWTIIEQPEGVNVVSCKWVFHIKRNVDGEIEWYKARLVAKGYSQVHGVNYYDTYAPVVHLASLCTILTIAARNDWDINVFDFQSAFLNGKLDPNEVIYMQLPPGLKVDKKFRCAVALLRVALYGSKQGALKWYQELCQLLEQLGFCRVESDWGVFYRHIGIEILILASHVDDCMVTGSNKKMIKDFKANVAARFKLTGLGPISSLLGMKVMRDRVARTLSLSQESYIEGILVKYNFTDL